MGKQHSELDEQEKRLAAFTDMDDSQMEEGTSTYFKFKTPGDKLDGLFKGIESRPLDKNNPEKITDCAILQNLEGEKFILAQTIVVKELKKKWDELTEVGFPVRIIYKGVIGEGADQYQSFRLLFESPAAGSVGKKKKDS